MNKKVFKVVIAIIGIFFVSFFCWHYFSSTNLSNSQKLVDFITKQDNVKKIYIKATKTNNEFLAVYYDDGKSERLSIFEKDNIFSDRYKYFGGSIGDSLINTFNYKQSSRVLIVLYGDNSDLKAFSYKFENNKKTYLKQNLGINILDLYSINNTSDITCFGYLYDIKGNVIDEINEK